MRSNLTYRWPRNPKSKSAVDLAHFGGSSWDDESAASWDELIYDWRLYIDTCQSIRQHSLNNGSVIISRAAGPFKMCRRRGPCVKPTYYQILCKPVNFTCQIRQKKWQAYVNLLNTMLQNRIWKLVWEINRKFYYLGNKSAWETAGVLLLTEARRSQFCGLSRCHRMLTFCKTDTFL